MNADEALAILAKGPTERADVFEALRAAGLLRLSTGTGPLWTLNDAGRARLAALIGKQR